MRCCLTVVGWGESTIVCSATPPGCVSSSVAISAGLTHSLVMQQNACIQSGCPVTNTAPSTSYEWMVISGGKAQYKGFGTINGGGNNRFMLTCVDGDQPGGGGADKFRIRIWSDSGGLVYDNQLNAPDSDDPTTTLGGGSIVIHH